MRITFLVLLLSIFQLTPDYSFDYHLTYEFISMDSDSTHTRNYYISSKNNDYYSQIKINQKKFSELYFKDQNRITFSGKFDGENKNLDKFIIPDSLTTIFKNSNKSKAEKYVIEKLNDTTINNENYERIVFKPRNWKKNKRKNIGYNIYILDTNYNMKPFLPNPTELNIYKLRKNMSNGLVIEKHVYNGKNELIWSEKLKEINTIKLDLFIE